MMRVLQLIRGLVGIGMLGAVVTQGNLGPKRSGLKRDGSVAEGNQSGCSWEKAAGEEV